MHPRTPVLAKSPAEEKVFRALEQALPTAYEVIHHVRWLQSRPGHGARDGETDFLIIHPQKGILVLEVKGGWYRYDAGSGVWIRRLADGAETPASTDPFDQAVGAVHNLKRWLQALPGWKRAWGPFGHAVAFPDGVLKGAPLPHIQTELVLDAHSLAEGRVLSSIEAAFDIWANGQHLEGGGVARTIDSLAHDLEVAQPIGMVVEEAERVLRDLSPAQYGVLLMLAGNRRVSIDGPAGSGKTLIALEKARRLAADGRRTLFTCFNRPLADFLRGSVADVDGLEVSSFHQLSRRLAVEAGLRLPPQQNWSQKEWDEVVRFIEPAVVALGARYDALVVDEGQDFHEDWWLPLLTLLRNPDSDPLYVFYDSNQAIYRRPSGLPDGLATAHLWENFRNTKAVFETEMRYYSGDPVTCRGPEGPPVEWSRVPAAELKAEVGRVLHRWVREGGLSPRSVVVLTPRSLKSSAVVGRCGGFQLTPTPAGANDVPVSTIHRFKGLDAAAVIVCEVGDQSDAEKAQLMYVACSRARTLLAVLETL